jgi:hypothetical protein
MKIRIETEKVIANPQNGPETKMRKILSIQALALNKLPEVYLAGSPYCYLSNEGNLIIHGSKNIPTDLSAILVNSHYSEEHFKDLLSIIQKCGDRLHRINSEWSGKETFEV